MKVYIDVVIFLNFFYDFLILASTSTLLKRNIGVGKIILGSLIGELSLLTLFISIGKFSLIVFKILLSVVMIFASFGKKNFSENIFYFYVITIVLGGSCYLFGDSKYLQNTLLLVLISPIIITLYIKSLRISKEKLKVMHDVIIIDGINTYKFNGYLDTGNKLVDPITKLPVIMVSNNINFLSQKIFYVPYVVVNNTSLMKCLKVDKVLIDNRVVNVLLGLCDDDIFTNDVDVILNDSLREMI